jgi:hypothetical protein
MTADQTNSTHVTTTVSDRVITLSVLVVCAALLSPVLAYRVGLDQGIFAYIAAALLEGRWPYIDTWDQAWPGGFVLHAGEILLFGKSIFMFRVFDWLWQLTSAWLIFRITRRIGTTGAAMVAAAIFCLIYQGYGPWNTAQREGFAMLPVLAGYWLFLTRDRRSAVATAAWIGLGLGLAVSIKPTMLALAGLYVPLVLKIRRDSFSVILAAAGALVAPMALFTAFYWHQDGLRALYEACIGYQLEAYVGLLREDESVWAYWWFKLTRMGANSVGIALIFLPFLFWGQSLPERWMLYLGYLGTLFAVFVQGTFAGYHYLPGLGLGSILIGIMFAQVAGLLVGRRSTRIGRVRIQWDVLLAILVVMAAIPAYVRAGSVQRLMSLRFLERPLPDEYRNGTVFDFTESWDTAEYLRTHTRPGDRIQVWGHESLVYYLAERHAASRFQTSHGLTVRHPGEAISEMQQRWRREFMESMHQTPPAFIAVVNDDHWWWAPENKSSRELLDEFPEWKAFIQEHYRQEKQIGRFDLFRHIPSQQGQSCLQTDMPCHQEV